MSPTHAAGLAFRDPLFLAALAAGPVAWGILAIFLPVTTDPGWPATRLWFFLSAVLLYPVLEEIVFRGLLQGWLLEREWGRRTLLGPVSIANAIAALTFAVAHLIHQPPLWAMAVFLPGLVFGYFREVHGLWSAILLHVVYNAGFIWLFVH